VIPLEINPDNARDSAVSKILFALYREINEISTPMRPMISGAEKTNFPSNDSQKTQYENNPKDTEFEKIKGLFGNIRLTH